MSCGNTFGRLFRISTWGESHGNAIGVTLDGCPPSIQISSKEIQQELNRRRPGQSRLTTPRNETDLIEVLSGITTDRCGFTVTTGTPIAMIVRNYDQRLKDYEKNDLNIAYRPSHADATYDAKYGVRFIAGGGRSSARETIGRVAAGSIAKKILRIHHNIDILAYVSKVQNISSCVYHESISAEDIDKSLIRCPDKIASEKMITRIDEVREDGNSIGGTVTCIVKNVPSGLGSPVFDKLEAELGKACLSLPAAKGFESGSGFGGTLLTGKDHNDEMFVDKYTGITRTKTNRSGGINGGISNGEPIVINVAFKPTSTIRKTQKTVTRDGTQIELSAKGRHDPCVLPRAVPIVESMVALTLVDSLMLHRGQSHLKGKLSRNRINPSGMNAPV